MSKMLTTKEIKKRIEEVHGSSIRLLDKFNGYSSKNTLQCTECDMKWSTLVRNVIHCKTGCPTCAKERQAKNISKGHANSTARIQRFRDKIKVLEKRFNITCVEEFDPADFTKTSRFLCNTCDRLWYRPVNRLAGTKHGCPACGEKFRLLTSHSTECRDLRSVAMSISTKEARKRIAYITKGRTRLISPWQGARKLRTYECTTCEHQWDVTSSQCGIKTEMYCPKCAPTSYATYSAIAVHWLEAEAKSRRIKILHGKNGGEYKLPELGIRVDGYNARTKTVFEFHGDAFHGNPKKYAPTTKCHPFSNSTAEVLYKRTKARDKAIKDAGYALVVMWEHRYRAMLRKQFISTYS